MKKQIIFFLTSMIFSVFIISCENHEKIEKVETTAVQFKTAPGEPVSNDSLAMIALTTEVYTWKKALTDDFDFEPYLEKETDTLYKGLDMDKHNQRLDVLRNSKLFTEKFLENYHRIGLAINKELENRTMVWKVGELPPFGYGKNQWFDGEIPITFAAKLWVMRLKVENNIASYDWGLGDGTSYNIKALKDDEYWKILEMEGFDYDRFIRSFQKSNDFTGSWVNDLVTFNIGESSLALLYHGQCVYFYPIRKISDTEFEMIWAREMDCVFDNGTDKQFKLQNFPQIGKPFAKMILKDNILNVEYYYKEWVEKYTEEVQSDVFTLKYHRKIENY